MSYEDIKNLSAYEWISREELADIHAEGIILRHRKSGARIALIPCADENKVFNIAFRTPPHDSTGVAHIIEHTVLCGSREFPLKDPFVELAKGSLNTFLNAMTYPDKTMYPVASMNAADFRNLMHVYLDAVFYPNIYNEENIFRQEGWHYELRSPEDPLTVNGVVYNEMKGVFSSPDDVLERETMNVLFPDTPYGVESGGDPDVIPELTYEDYLSFHKTYYHPSNSYIFLYGDMDMEDTLRFIDEHYLSNFEAISVSSAIPRQEPFEGMKKVTREYPVSPEDDADGKAFLSYHAVAGDPLDTEEMLAFSVLDYALLSAPGAPVRQALLDAGIGMDVYGQYVDGIAQPYFSVVAKYTDASEAERFEQIITDVLTRQAEEGINPKSLTAALNYLEFQFREADYATAPKGLMYTITMLDTWLYDEDKPFDALKQLGAFRKLREKIGDGYFEELIRTKLLDNPHRALVVLTPRQGLAEKREAERAESLARIKSAMSEEQIADVIRRTEALLAWQDEPETRENIDKLPVLRREDIGTEATQLKNETEYLTVKAEDGAEIRVESLLHEADSNGIGYIELLWDAGFIREEQIPYLGLLKAVLMNVDTENYGYMELNNEIHAESGGISCGLVFADESDSPDRFRVFFGVRAKALYEKLPRAMELIREFLAGSSLADGKRLHEILSQQVSTLQMSLQSAGHSAAALRASAYISSSAAFQDMSAGIGYYKVIRDLESSFEEREEEIRASLAGLLSSLFVRERLLVSYTAEREHFKDLPELIPPVVWQGLAEQSEARLAVKPYGRLNEGFMTPGQVQFVAMAGNYRMHDLPYSGVMPVFRQVMAYEYLWQNVRVRGGAYGCGASFKRNGSGMFTSYRDPHLLRTREIYEQVPEYLASFEADDKEMTKYVIGTISSMDTPLTPAMVGSISLRMWLSGITQEMLQKTRDEVLSADPASVRALALQAKAVLDDDCFCVIGSESAIKEAEKAFLHTEYLL